MTARGRGSLGGKRRQSLRILRGVSVALGFVGGLAGPAFAQGVPPAGALQSVNPGRALQQFAPPTAVAPPSGEIEVPATNPETPPTGADKVFFKLTDIVIDDSTVYRGGSLKSIYAKSLGQRVSLTKIYDIANAITEKYRSDGYFLSKAIIPVQRIHNGVVHLRAVEGFIDQVHLQGVKSKRLEAYAQAIRAVRPITTKILERYVLLANDLAGMTVQSVLAPSPTVQGAADLTMIAVRKTFGGSAEMDNFGTPYQGPWQAMVTGSMAGVLGHDEMISVRGATTSTPRQMGMFGINLALPIDDDGTSLVLDFSRNKGHPGYVLEPFGVHTLAYSASIAVQHYMIRSRAENLLSALTFSYLNSETRLNVPGSSDDHIRALRASLGYTRIDTLGGQNAVSAELSEGIPILNATRGGNNPLASRPDARNDFTKLVLNGSRLQDLGNNYALLLAMSAQSSFGERLLSSEQFALGGPVYGRGYDPSEVTGDNGVAGKLELQKTVPFTLYGRDRFAQFFGFYDVGEVMTSVVNAGAPGRQTLASTGTGVRLNFGNGVTSLIELAKPLTRAVSSEIGHEDDPKDWRIYFSLAAAF
ncbi:MAG TPA: ShlB/FhaC/HecB family hemolysin secretion/activation protein [Stellaceae bacterium]|nr:ShlB/FhaC/HecB family hemolysin secretion/activation protein [Stellaceae bacterium]